MSFESSIAKQAPAATRPEQAPSPGGVGPVFSPDQVVCALIGQRSIVLDGFGDVDVQLGRQLPNVPLSLLEDHQAQEQLIVQVDKFWAWRKFALAGGLLALVLLVGLTIGWLFSGSGDKATHAEALVWRVTKVQSDGVLVFLAGKEMLFPVGGMLPSGEALRYVDPVTQTFTTNAQSVTLKVKP